MISTSGLVTYLLEFTLCTFIHLVINLPNYLCSLQLLSATRKCSDHTDVYEQTMLR